MDLEIVILSEVKSDREGEISHDIPYATVGNSIISRKGYY